MNTTFDVLVIVLSSLLAIFLIMAIACIVLVYKLIKALRSVVAKGEHLVDSAEALGETLKRNASAVSLIKLVMNMVSKAKRG